MNFFHKYTEIIDFANLIRSTPVTLKLPPTRLRFKKLDELAKINTTTLDTSIGKLFDIFIRWMLQKAGGNLKTTKFWLNLQHPGTKHPDGFWLINRPYTMGNGHTLINMIAKCAQSNHALSLDETMQLSMQIFKTDTNVLLGQGGALSPEILVSFLNA